MLLGHRPDHGPDGRARTQLLKRSMRASAAGLGLAEHALCHLADAVICRTSALRGGFN